MISIIIPTYNESDNLPALVRQIFEVCGHNRLKTEVILLDDNSPDGTGEMAYYLRKFFPNLRTLHRKEKLGHASALLEGIAESKGAVVGTLYGDFSHPPELIPHLAIPIMHGNVDIAIGSRYLDGSVRDLSALKRLRRRILQGMYRPLTGIHDSLSGFFFFRRDLLNYVRIPHEAPAFLPELLLRSGFRVAQEIPYHYQPPPTKGDPLASPLRWLDYLTQLAILYKVKFVSSKRGH
jgi:dolichol-phosphate mannosyltransferase